MSGGAADRAGTPRRAGTKRVGFDEATRRAAEWLRAGEGVTVVHGAFDLPGAAHARELERIRRGGARVIVAVVDDVTAAAMLGAGSPVLPAEERAVIVAGLRAVDVVFVLDAGMSARAIATRVPGVAVVASAAANAVAELRARRGRPA